jgi:CRISPR-associated protein Cas2
VHRVIIAYDIVCDKRRLKLMKYCKRQGVHVQKSVFECFLTGKGLEQTILGIERLIDPATDSVRLYVMAVSSPMAIRLIGTGNVPEFQQITIV